MHFSQAFQDGHFTKRELLFDMPLTPFFQNGNENAQGVIAQHRAPGDPRSRLGLGNCHRAAVVVSSSKCSLVLGRSISNALTAEGEGALLEFGSN